MSLKIRLARAGAKKRPFYRIVVADTRSPRDGRFIEKLGTFNPLLAKDTTERVQMNIDRISHWLGVGAQPTDRVLRLLDAAGIRSRPARMNPKKGEPGKKAQERAQEREDAANAAAEAAAAPAPEPAPEPEPAEEPVAAEPSAETPPEAPAEEPSEAEPVANTEAEAPAAEASAEEPAAEESPPVEADEAEKPA